ncbi:flagellar biosynthetic protein FliR [Roseicyclus sp.]|uniref:flagellar biosynthetic protein FliR n=1 Tax=Roseicyclus sp. TaxID=1914329 RepID=UPI003F6A88E1
MEYGALPGLAMQDVMDQALIFLVLSLRIGAFLLSAPFFGSRMIPLPVRIVFSASLAAFLIGRVPVPAIEDLTTLRVLPIIAQELALGLSAGLLLTILFSAVALAGEKVAATAGLSFAFQIDPNSGGQMPLVSQIFTLFLTVIFLSLNGHLAAFAILIESYSFVPIGAGINYAALFTVGEIAGGTMFATAARLMLPIVTVLFLVNIAIGVITRSAPTLNLFSFGFPITLFAVFMLLFMSTGPIGFAFQDLVAAALVDMGDLLRGAALGQ